MNGKMWLVGAGVAAFGLLMLVSVDRWQLARAGQEPPREDRQAAEQEVDAEALERRLDQIEALIDRAEQQGDRDRVAQLRAEGQDILDRLEALERSRVEDEEPEDERWELEQRELELHRRHLEIERLHIEMNALRQESTLRAAQIGGDYLASVSYALQQAVDHMGEEGARGFLEELLEDTESPLVERMIRQHLARLSFQMDDPEEGQEHLRSLILEE